MRLINMQCKIIIKQNDHDVCKTGLDKEHAGVDVWAKSLSFAVCKESSSEWIDSREIWESFFCFC